jgi:glycosyltransferase involved in cell wall biosynthesis
VTVVIPTLNEESTLGACLKAVARQTYPRIIEILVIDGGSRDRTREVASSYDAVTLLDNPRRVQAAALSTGLERAIGDVVIRIDAHSLIADDYVERCVTTLEASGAAMVGGAIDPVTEGGSIQRGITMAMGSALGVGTARFHRPGAQAGWVDTVYLGAYRTSAARGVGGYDERFHPNEDAEFAWRMRAVGGVWFDPSIRSRYIPRTTLAAVGRQFFRYGWGRAHTVSRHPRSLRARQLAAPLLVLGLVSPRRVWVASAYGVVVLGRCLVTARSDPKGAVAMGLALPVMHVAWGTGFFAGVASQAGAVVGRSRFVRR